MAGSTIGSATDFDSVGCRFESYSASQYIMKRIIVMFLLLDEQQSTLNEKEFFDWHRGTISRCFFAASLVDRKTGEYKVLKERYGIYKIGEVISESQVFEHCWYIMGKGRMT